MSRPIQGSTHLHITRAFHACAVAKQAIWNAVACPGNAAASSIRGSQLGSCFMTGDPAVLGCFCHDKH